jgi:hypothetical protein
MSGTDASTGAANEVAVQQTKRTSNGAPLDVDVATHRHQDHISGFGERGLWENVPVRVVSTFTASGRRARAVYFYVSWEARTNARGVCRVATVCSRESRVLQSSPDAARTRTTCLAKAVRMRGRVVAVRAAGQGPALEQVATRAQVQRQGRVEPALRAWMDQRARAAVPVAVLGRPGSFKRRCRFLRC